MIMMLAPKMIVLLNMAVVIQKLLMIAMTSVLNSTVTTALEFITLMLNATIMMLVLRIGAIVIPDVNTKLYHVMIITSVQMMIVIPILVVPTNR